MYAIIMLTWFFRDKTNLAILGIIVAILLFFSAIAFLIFSSQNKEITTSKKISDDIADINNKLYDVDAIISSEQFDNAYSIHFEAIDNIQDDNEFREQNRKFGHYISIFSSLVAQYNSSNKNIDIKKIADSLSEFLKENFPEQYNQLDKKSPGYWRVE